MKLYNCNLSSNGVIIKIQTDNPAFWKYLISDPILHAHIPNLIIDDKDNNKSHFTIIHVTSNLNLIRRRGDQLEIYTKIPEVVKYSQLLFLTLPIFEFYYEMKGVYSVAGAAIGNRAKGVVLLGGQRSGKSTLSSLLSGPNRINYWSDERLLIDLDKGLFLGGNRMISLRRNILQNKNNFHFLRSVKLNESQSTDKLYYLPPNKPSSETKIKYLLLIQLNNIPFYTTKLTDFDVKLHLYNNITQTIRSCLNPILNLNYSTPSFDNNILANKRLCKISDLVNSQKVEGYELNGSMEDIQSWIAKISH